MKKKCTKCKVKKDISKFSKDRSKEDGAHLHCKECEVIRVRDYYRTFNGFLSKIYNNQINSSIRRGYSLPDYTKAQLGVWIKNQLNFQGLWDTYVNSEYDPNLIPSCDRTDDYKAYSLDILQLLPWGEHKYKSYKDKKEGKNNKQAKAVVQLTKEGVFIKDFYSSMHVEREIGIHHSNIRRCCLGEYKSAGGFVWKFKNKVV